MSGQTWQDAELPPDVTIKIVDAAPVLVSGAEKLGGYEDYEIDGAEITIYNDIDKIKLKNGDFCVSVCSPGLSIGTEYWQGIYIRTTI